MKNTPYVTIGISGHIRIIKSDEDLIKKRLIEKIRELQLKYSGSKIKILVGKAEGVDTLTRDIITESIGELEDFVASDSYDQQARYLIDRSDEIIVVWDGVFNFKKGGTSEIVRLALGSNKNLTLHHLICRRQDNHFPVNSLSGDVIDHETRQLNRLPLTENLSWIKKEIEGEQKSKMHSNANRLKSLSSFLTKIFRRHLFWYFMIPIFFSITTLICGTIGFGQIYKNDFGNNFFRAINLITLNASIIDEVMPNGEKVIPDTWLQCARITGLLTIIFTFLYALLLALKDVRESLIRLVWRIRRYEVVIVIGLNEKSYYLIKSLSNKKTRIVVLTERENSIYDNELKQTPRLILLRGSLSSATLLRSVYAMEAAKIFVMSDKETKNVRAVQELAIMNEKKTNRRVPKIFVHIQIDEYVKFLRASLNNTELQIFIFNIYENIVRRLFLHFPPDRFYQSKHSKSVNAIIIGYEEMGREILLTLLKQGHYQMDHHLHISVYCKNAASCMESFNGLYPLFKIRETDFETLKDIKNATWKNIKVSFLELPQSDHEWLDDNQPIYKNIVSTDIINVYACLNDSIKSASHLNTILPKLNDLKKQTACDVQVFCYYNFPDRKEEQRIEDYFNALAPDIFVKCFGNFLRECSAKAIQNMSLDETAKLINGFYVDSNKFKNAITKKKPVKDWPVLSDQFLNAEWAVISSKDKISSQQAGDHLWIKLRIFYELGKQDFLYGYIPVDDHVLKTFGEIEHRRWAAEMLLQGFVPYHRSDQKRSYKKEVKTWTNQSKKEIQKYKRHINLVPLSELADSELKKDHDQIIAIPYFLRYIIPSFLNKINNNKNMDNNQDLAFLLWYAARIDTNISDSEKEIIMSHLRSGEEWDQLQKIYEQETEMALADKVTGIMLRSTGEQKKAWIGEIKQLVSSDDSVSGMEQYLLSMMNRY